MAESLFPPIPLVDPFGIDVPQPSRARPSRWPQVRVRTFTGGRYALSAVDPDSGRYALVEGDPARARVVEVHGDRWTESTAAAIPVSGGVAEAVSRIAGGAGGVVTAQARTAFPDGTVRWDDAATGRGHTARWQLPGGGETSVTWGLDGTHEIVDQRGRRIFRTAVDGPGRRTTQVFDSGGDLLGSVSATVPPTSPGTVYGSSSGTGPSSPIPLQTWTGQVNTAGGQPVDVTVEKLSSGQIHEEFTINGPDRVGHAEVYVQPDGSQSVVTSMTQTLRNGQMIKTDSATTIEKDGQTSWSQSSAVNLTTGEKQTYETGENEDGEHYVNWQLDDGQGNTVSTTRTEHDDGSFDIVATTHPAGGQATIERQSYDANGTPIPNDGTTQETPERRHPPATDPLSSPPADDGADAGPPHWGDPLTAQIMHLLTGHRGGWPAPGDPNPLAGKAGADGSFEALVARAKEHLAGSIRFDGRGSLGDDTGGGLAVAGPIVDHSVDAPDILGAGYWGDPNSSLALITGVARVAGARAADLALRAATTFG